MTIYIPDRPPTWSSAAKLDKPTAELRGAVETLWAKIIELRGEIDKIKAFYSQKTGIAYDNASNNASKTHDPCDVECTDSLFLNLAGQTVSGTVLPAGIDHSKLFNLDTDNYSHISADQKISLSGNNYWLAPVISILDNRGVVFNYT
jgi:hypothetical protein